MVENDRRNQLNENIVVNTNPRIIELSAVASPLLLVDLINLTGNREDNRSLSK